MDPSASHLMRSAEAAHAEGNFAACADLCRQVLAINAKSLPATVLLGISSVKTGDYAEAIRFLMRACRIDSACFEALLWLGIARRENHEIDESIACLRQALQIWPGNPGALANLGLSYLKLPDAAKAIRSFQRAIVAKPNDPEYHQNLGFAYQLAGENKLAAGAFEASLHLDPRSIPSLVSVGQLYLELAQRERAIAVFRQAYTLSRNTARGQIQLARALREEGDFAGAERALNLALEYEPDSVDALEVVSNLFQQLGRFEEAVRIVDAAIALDPKRARLYFNRVYSRKTTPEDAAALMRMEAMLGEASLSDRRYLHYALGKAYNDLGDLSQAMAQFDLANRAMRELQGNHRFEREIHVEEFNRKIATFTPAFFADYAPLGDPDETPVFIIGMIRSGTSLVEQILSAHPAVVGAGELLYWFQNAPAMVSRSVGSISPQVLAHTQSGYRDLLRGIGPDARRVTDKMPHNYMFVGEIHAAFPKARFIHCRRHPVDNCLSIYMTPYQAPLDFAHDKGNITFVYREYQRLVAHWQQAIPANRWLDVDYEALVADPEPTTRQMVQFMGLPWDDACLRPEDNERAVKTPSMWQVRQPVYRTSTERWRKYEPWLGEFASLLESPLP